MKDYSIGIDLGGTNIKALAIDNDGAVLSEATCPTADLGDSQWSEQVRQLFIKIVTAMGEAPAHVGICCPGLLSLDQESIVSMPSRLRGLEGLVWSQFLNFHKKIPVLNDAKSALLAEHWLGNAKGARNVVLLTLGTGVGGAAMVDGKLLHGHLGRAGHLGHISLDPNGKPDGVNTPGSLENAIGQCTLAERCDGRFVTTEELVIHAETGDSQAQRVWLLSIKNLAAALTSFINILDPEIIILGGGIAKAGNNLLVPLEKQLRSMEWQPNGFRVPIVLARRNEHAGALGAAYYARQFEAQNSIL